MRARKTFSSQVLMPRLSSSPTSCVRWRLQDLQDMLSKQLIMIDEMNKSTRRKQPWAHADA